MFINWSENQKKQYAKETFRLCKLLKAWGFQSHLQFGALLGCVREGKLIDSDGDIDICYLSNYKEKHKIIQECKDLYRKLYGENILLRYFDKDYFKHKKLGFEPFGQAHVHFYDHTIDLFTSWIDNKGNYWTCQWGNFGKTGFVDTKFYGFDFKIPAEYDKILTRLFGNWKVPAPDKTEKLLERKCYLCQA